MTISNLYGVCMNTLQKENNFGISAKTLSLIIEQLKGYPQIEKAIIFGSRAMGNYKPGSDIDLAITGKGINYKLLVKLGTVLNEELPIPYKIDLIHFDTIANPELTEHILQHGKIIYER